MDQANEHKLRAALGPRADFYLRRWAAMDEGGRKASWNWAACLLNVGWFAYRKMWGPMLAMGLAWLAAAPFLDIAHPNRFRVVAFSLVGLSFLTGTFGNWLYRRQVDRLVARVPEEELAAKGGVSLAAGIGAFVGLAVLSAIVGMLPALLAQS